MPNTSRKSSRTRGSTRASSGARNDGGERSEATRAADEGVGEKMRRARGDASEDAPARVSDRRASLREDVPGGALARTRGGVSRGARGEEG